MLMISVGVGRAHFQPPGTETFPEDAVVKTNGNQRFALDAGLFPKTAASTIHAAANFAMIDGASTGTSNFSGLGKWAANGGSSL